MAGVAEKDEFNVLVLGMGTGTFAMECYRYFDNAKIDGVEIDQKIIDLAYDRFGLVEDERITTTQFDARAFLRNAGKYDVIMVDAYRDITVQFQLSSVEFFSEVKEHLTDDGVMILNLNMTSNQEGSINDYICDTVDSVFDTVYTAQAGGNIEVFASENKDIAKNFRKSYPTMNPELHYMMMAVDQNLRLYEGGDLILTDDKAPVELLGMRVVDELISVELERYRELFKGISIKEMIDMLK
jgi:spermidine synthase